MKIEKGDLVRIGKTGRDIWSVDAIVLDEFQEFAKLKREDVFVMISTDKIVPIEEPSRWKVDSYKRNGEFR